MGFIEIDGPLKRCWFRSPNYIIDQVLLSQSWRFCLKIGQGNWGFDLDVNRTPLAGVRPLRQLRRVRPGTEDALRDVECGGHDPLGVLRLGVIPRLFCGRLADDDHVDVGL